MGIDDKKIKEMLISGGYVTGENVKKAEKFAKDNNTLVTEYLFLEGLITKDILGQALAEYFKVPYADLNSKKLSSGQVLMIPRDVAEKFRVVLFFEKEKEITITTDDPLADGLFEELKKTFPDKKISIAYSLSEDIDSVFVYYREPLEERFLKIIKEGERVAPKIFEQILSDAFTDGVSDIHFEPQGKDTAIRFRIDGVLRGMGRIPKEHYENVINCVKIQSHLRIDEHFVAQDGAIRYEKNNLTVDLRVSVVPTIEGEKIVLRVLAAYVRGFSLNDLGLAEYNQQILEEISKKPFGMILVAGPTGSGKTTTLYALLRILNRPEINVMTIEDPVEYKVSGINQIQTNFQTNLTFAKGLRSIVRQDPDIILVGEVRDNETAEIAVNAALTGHLLLSTFHANDAATAIPRLLDMGIEPFLLASTIKVIIAQRLARKICEHCRHSIVVSEKDFSSPSLSRAFKFFGSNGKKFTLYGGKGCAACGNSGYKGRTAIFEFIRITPEMQEFILKNPSTQQIWQLACRQGSRSMFEDGIEKVKNGITTIEELLRVAEPPY
ncbi:MAG TPA: GspE/PulE family protein [Patescibacteria group bacterium]|nr:GspE/PulE family protein [Patescibacteria group bacterium]